MSDVDRERERRGRHKFIQAGGLAFIYRTSTDPPKTPKPISPAQPALTYLAPTLPPYMPSHQSMAALLVVNQINCSRHRHSSPWHEIIAAQTPPSLSPFRLRGATSPPAALRPAPYITSLHHHLPTPSNFPLAIKYCNDTQEDYPRSSRDQVIDVVTF